MTKANDLASLLDANGDVVSSALDNVPASDLVNDTTPQLGGTLDTNTNDINFGTNVKSNYGTSAQLMMYHDGSNGWIKGNNTGNNSIAIQSGGTGSVMISGSSGQNIISQQGDSAYLHHAGFAKLITTATGVDAINTAGSSTSRFGSTYNTGANDGTLVIGNGGSGKAMLRFDYEGTNTDRARIGVSSSAQQLEFYTAGDNKRATLDASGNLLVGTTNTDPAFNNVTGQSMASTGQLQVTRDGGTAALFNRKTSDGDIVQFRKDGGTVGSIGSVIGARLRIDSNSAAGYLGIAGTDRYYWNNTELGVNSDNAYNLGSAGYRFNNLYLSGGVYLGGTGSANQLNTYEEGTWNPVLNGSTSGTFAGIGSYVKIGTTVLLTCTFNAIGTGLVGNLQITGVPFTFNPSGSLDMYIPLQFFQLNWDNNAKAVYGFAGDAGTTIVPYYSNDNSVSTVVQGSHLGTQTYLRFVQTFETA
jgi:hypothetical protein